MLARTLAFITGIYCLLQFPYLPSLWLLGLLPVSFVLSRYHFSFNLLFCLIFGFSWALVSAHLKMNDELNENIENETVFIKGEIASLPEFYDDHVRFLINIDEVSNLSGEQFTSPGLVRLSWYKNDAVLAPGESWQLKVKLKRPYSFMNSGGFDYEAWMMRQGIKATGYVKQDSQNKKLADTNHYVIERLRYQVAERLKSYIDKPLLGFVLALTLGDRSQLSPEQWQILHETGTSHLVAISGLHLGLIAGFIYFFSSFIWRRFYCLTQTMPAPMFASIMAFIGALIYALLAGFSLPTQRALIMIAVFLVAILNARRLLMTNVICIALVLVLLIDPFALIAADFYLSFFAVISILYLTRFRINLYHNVIRWVNLQCLLSLALLPILIFWFKQIPLYSVLANLVVIPVIGFLVLPLSLMALVFLFPSPVVSQYVYFLIEKINNYYWTYLEYLSELNNSVIPIAAPTFYSLLLVIVGVMILIMPKGLPARYLGFFFFLPLLFPVSKKLNNGEFEFNLLDVGQGLSAVVQTKEHVLVYDTGANYSPRFNIGDAVVKPYLREKGIKDISLLMISHGDNDHIGGAKAVINNFKVDKVLTSAPEKMKQRFSDQEINICHAGQHWQWDGVYFEILHPDENSHFDGNNGSCVLKVSSNTGSVLLTGDIEKEAEASLVKQYGNYLDVDALLVPHHGSKTSSTKAFISTVSPKYALIPAGYNNRFGFPKKDIMDRYDAEAVKTFISYETGEISFNFRDEGLQIDEFRTKNRRFWHH
jgi:competence protein ComEC